MRVHSGGIGLPVEDRFLDIRKGRARLAAGLEEERRPAPETVAEVGAVIDAHGDHEVRFAQDGFGERAPPVAADGEAPRQEVLAHAGRHDVRKVDRAGRGDVDVGAIAQGMAQAPLRRQAAKDVAGADEQHALHRSRSQPTDTRSRRVTNSSAAVGWMPIVASNCALVAPSFTAMAMPWISSPASGPSMCAPTTRWLAASTTSFMKTRSWFAPMVCLSERKAVL